LLQLEMTGGVDYLSFFAGEEFFVGRGLMSQSPQGCHAIVLDDNFILGNEGCAVEN
jgi:hypothetical protein